MFLGGLDEQYRIQRIMLEIHQDFPMQEVTGHKSSGFFLNTIPEFLKFLFKEFSVTASLVTVSNTLMRHFIVMYI